MCTNVTEQVAVIFGEDDIRCIPSTAQSRMGYSRINFASFAFTAKKTFLMYIEKQTLLTFVIFWDILFMFISEPYFLFEHILNNLH